MESFPGPVVGGCGKSVTGDIEQIDGGSDRYLLPSEMFRCVHCCNHNLNEKFVIS